MSKYIVLSVESSSYTSRSGQEVNLLTIYYFDPSDKLGSRIEQGYRLLNKNVYPDFTLADFPEVPGYYDLGFRPSRNRRGQLEPKLVSVEFIDAFSISENKDNFLVLGAKKYEYQPEPGRVLKGLKFFAVDPTSYREDDKFIGFSLLEASLEKVDFKNFSSLPGYYQLDFQQVRGKNGDSLYKPISAKFQGVFNLDHVNSLSVQPSVFPSS